MNNLYHNPNVHPRPEGSTIQSPQPTTTEEPQNFGNPTNRGAGIMGMLRNWFYGYSNVGAAENIGFMVHHIKKTEIKEILTITIQ